MIQKLLDMLEADKRDQLIYALEQNISHYIELADDKFIGVNVNQDTDLVILEEIGAWSYGRLYE